MSFAPGAPNGGRVAAEERFLVTGAHGCIGAWVVRRLISEGAHVVALDVSDDDRRLRLVLSEAELASLPAVRTDITDLDSLEHALAEHEITNVIHLAALQVPFCRADPSLGARVNVVGTVNVLEAAARRSSPMAPVVYASSIAAYDAVDAGADGDAPSATASRRQTAACPGRSTASTSAPTKARPRCTGATGDWPASGCDRTPSTGRGATRA